MILYHPLPTYTYLIFTYLHPTDKSTQPPTCCLPIYSLTYPPTYHSPIQNNIRNNMQVIIIMIGVNDMRKC
jgi:hypothetical protein